MSADFWGLKTAGGTATAYHLLAAMLAKSHALEVCHNLFDNTFMLCASTQMHPNIANYQHKLSSPSEKGSEVWQLLHAFLIVPEVWSYITQHV